LLSKDVGRRKRIGHIAIARTVNAAVKNVLSLCQVTAVVGQAFRESHPATPDAVAHSSRFLDLD
jgi:hypothetical protein